MPDITMCTGEGCPAATTCYRVTAPPSSHRQAFFAEPPFHELVNQRFSDNEPMPDRCRYFMTIYAERVRKTT